MCNIFQFSLFPELEEVEKKNLNEDDEIMSQDYESDYTNADSQLSNSIKNDETEIDDDVDLVDEVTRYKINRQFLR